MANQIVDIPDLISGEAGLTASLVSCADDSLVVAYGAIVEQANALTHYRRTYATTATGWHYVPVKDADGTVRGSWAVKLTNTATVHFAKDIAALDWAAIQNETSTQQLSGTTVKAVTDAVKIQSGITKNAALANFKFLMISSADHISGKAGLTITAERSIDDGAFAACANAATELSGGAYEIDFAQTDLNGDVVMFKFTAPGADPRFMTIRTTP